MDWSTNLQKSVASSLGEVDCKVSTHGYASGKTLYLWKKTHEGGVEAQSITIARNNRGVVNKLEMIPNIFRAKQLDGAYNFLRNRVNKGALNSKSHQCTQSTGYFQCNEQMSSKMKVIFKTLGWWEYVVMC